MPATKSTVISRGFGSFGAVGLLPTRGYGIGTFVPGEWPQIRARVQVRRASAPIQERRASAPAQVRRASDPQMGE